MKTISVKLPDALHNRLAKAAEEKGVNKSDLLRLAIESYLAQVNGRKRLTMGDLIGDLAGCIKDAPSDLASNPRYMEGFGQ